MLESKCSCQKCKCIFLIPLEGEHFFSRKLHTYNIKDESYVKYMGKKYLSRDFLVKYINLLELRVIELDHLTEEEQRERGILGPDEVYEAKIKNVSRFSSYGKMKREAKKCQNLCSFCHLEETMSRYKNSEINYSDKSVMQNKKDYVNNLKMKLEGCSCCKYNPNILRFLEFDHIDPTTKITSIANMVMKKKYTLDDIKEECKKCRLLCRNCHKIRTSKIFKLSFLIPQLSTLTSKWNISPSLFPPIL